MHPHDLNQDLQTLSRQIARRRQALLWLAGAGGMTLLGCGGGGNSDANASETTPGTGGSGSTCSVIPEETAGPYPGDGSNSSNGSIANALALSGIVRSDIRSSFAGATAVAGGIPMTVTLTLVNTNGSCAALAGYAVYLWHCDAGGRYSMYSNGVTGENFLRGVQQADANGQVTFTTIVPGCYSGRMPHMHFEVYRSGTAATSYTNKIKTSQLALPTEICRTVYNSTALYSASVANFAAISFNTDNVFSDGVTTQLASVTGTLAAGYAATLVVGVAA